MDSIPIMLSTTFGLSILSSTLETAARFIYLKNTSRNSEAKQCYFFIQSTNLDVLIEYYGLDYDPQGIRSCFNNYIKRKKCS